MPDDADPNRTRPDNSVPKVDPYAVLSHLLAGVVLYGGIGWLLDWWLGTRGFVAAGLVLGAAAGVWAVWLRYGRS